MYVGHFAIGMAIKAKRPDIPTLPILIGVGIIDILDGLFTMIGLNKVTVNPLSGPYLYFDLTFIDWDHSLLMATVWSLVWAALFWRDKRVAVVAGLAAYSHFLADWPMHNQDLALYPYSVEHLGYGLWNKLGVGSWVLEGAFALALCAYAGWAQAKRGVSMLWPNIFLVLAFLNLSPWLTPTQWIAKLAEPYAHIGMGALVALGFVGPGLLLTWLVNRAERMAVKPVA